MKRLMIGFAAAIACGTMAGAAENGKSWYVTAGPGYLNQSTDKMDFYGATVEFGRYLGQSDSGAFKVGGSIGAYYANEPMNIDGFKTSKFDYIAVPFLLELGYEFKLDPVRLSLGPAVGFTALSIDGSGRGEFYGDTYNYEVSGSEALFTWGVKAGLAVDVTDNLFIALDYRYLMIDGFDIDLEGDVVGKLTADDMKGHLATLSLGFRF